MPDPEMSEEHQSAPAAGTPGWYWEALAVFVLTAAAAFVRLWHLTTLPYGFHNDEGNVTIDALRILDHGWIGAYSPLANGYPIAVNYWVAPFIKVLGEGVLAVRLPMALLGIITVPLAYYTFRMAIGWRGALCGSVLIAFSLWHLHLSRVGFPVIGWPVAELLAMLFLQLAFRHLKWWWFAAAGVCIGVGTWVYVSALLFAAGAAIYLAAWFVVRAVARWRAALAGGDLTSSDLTPTPLRQAERGVRAIGAQRLEVASSRRLRQATGGGRCGARRGFRRRGSSCCC